MSDRRKALRIGALLLAASSAIGALIFRFSPLAHLEEPAPPHHEEHPVAPKFRLQDIAGRPLELSDYRGKVVLLDFWATWCTPCRWQVPELVELQAKYRTRGLRVIGISMDDEAKPVRVFYKDFEMNYPVAMGGDPVADLFGRVPGLPTTFLIGRDGRIHDKHVGARGMSFFEPKVRTLLAADLGAEPQNDQRHRMTSNE